MECGGQTIYQWSGVDCDVGAGEAHVEKLQKKVWVTALGERGEGESKDIIER